MNAQHGTSVTSDIWPQLSENTFLLFQETQQFATAAPEDEHTYFAKLAQLWDHNPGIDTSLLSPALQLLPYVPAPGAAVKIKGIS